MSSLGSVAKFLVTSISDEKYNSYLCQKIEEIGNEAIASRGVFIIGLSGGSIINYLCEGVAEMSTDWSRWKMFLCDERLVPVQNNESTFGEYSRRLLPLIPQFNPTNFLQPLTHLPGEESSAEYETRLRSLWTVDSKDPAFGMADCLLLGVGPDGHTCSLFPNHPVLGVEDCWVSHIEDSPKPPPARITLTYPFINKATNILIAGKGPEKWTILKKVESGEDYPIGRVDNPGGHLEWILNTPAKDTVS